MILKRLFRKLIGRSGTRFVRRAMLLRRLRHEFALDRRRYALHSFPSDGKVDDALHGANLEAQLTKDYHRVEKALALESPRRPFGVELQERLETLLPVARAEVPTSPVINHAESALKALLDWNEGRTDSVDEVSPLGDSGPRGVADAAAFFNSRHSVRHFSSKHVPDELLQTAVSLASMSPSVCNRQPWNVRFFRGAEAASVLQHQNGNAGFRENIPVAALVTVDERRFAGPGERNQGWIEGGIFASSLVWSLHALGLSSCMLNLSLTNGDVVPLRRHAALDDFEIPIMMIAVGYGAESHRRARSPRRDVAEIVRRPAG